MPSVIRNEDAENAILGNVILYGRDALNKVREFVNEEDFGAINADLFKTMCQQADQNLDYDLITLVDKFSRHAAIDRTYLINLINGAPHISNIENYIAIVKDCSVRRKKLNLLEDQKRRLLNGDDPNEIISSGIVSDMDILKNDQRDRVYHIRDIVREAYFSIEERMGKEIIGIPTGISPLDKLIGGLIEDSVITIAGRPGTGKTTLAQQIALNVSIEYTGCVCSLEMARQRLAVKFIANMSGVNSRRIDAPATLKDQDWAKMAHALGSLTERKLYIDDSIDMKASKIAVRMRKLAAEVNLRYIIIDYLQLALAESTKESRPQQITDSLRILKNLARELNLPIIVLSQISREIEKRTEPKPVLADLKESGSIEEMSDIVCFLYKDKESLEKTKTLNKEDWFVTPLNIAKNKYGPPDVTTDLVFMRDISKFVPLDYTQAPPPTQPTLFSVPKKPRRQPYD